MDTKKKVLLVDDEADFLDIMGQRIESWGYEVITALTAEDAMGFLRSKKPDVVVLDYIMPDVNGIQLLMKIRAVDIKIPVIIFTAKPEYDVIKDAERLDILAFIPKLSPYADTQSNLRSALNMAFKRGRKDG